MKHQTQRPNERRRRARLPGITEGWLLPDCGDLSDPWEVRIDNVSRHGVGFETSQKMNAGDLVRIRVGRGPMHLAKRLRVVSCRGTNRGTFMVGGEFLEDPRGDVGPE